MTERTCTNGDCGGRHYAKSLCRPCYDRQRNHGDPNYSKPAPKMVDGLRESDWAKIDKQPDGGCWLWTGAIGRAEGYGRVRRAGTTYGAHRYVWEALNGPVPAGAELDHLCRVRHCVNPAHLEPVTHLENVMRGESPSRYNAGKATCPEGHEYDRERRGRRICSECERQSARRRERTRPPRPKRARPRVVAA